MLVLISSLLSLIIILGVCRMFCPWKIHATVFGGNNVMISDHIFKWLSKTCKVITAGSR